MLNQCSQTQISEGETKTEWFKMKESTQWIS